MQRLFAIFLLLNCSYSFALDDLTKEYATELDLVEKYLNSIKTFSANFIQESPGGMSASGKFYLSRPGKMKIEYIDGPPVDIIVNNSVLLYYDRELEESSFLKTNTTPASLLTRRNISFSAKDIRIENVEKDQDSLKISLSKKNSKYQGKFSLVFKFDPIEFIKMEVEDDSGELTSINLFDRNFSPKLKRGLFIIKNNDLIP